MRANEVFNINCCQSNSSVCKIQESIKLWVLQFSGPLTVREVGPWIVLEKVQLEAKTAQG